MWLLPEAPTRSQSCLSARLSRAHRTSLRSQTALFTALLPHPKTVPEKGGLLYTVLFVGGSFHQSAGDFLYPCQMVGWLFLRHLWRSKRTPFSCRRPVSTTTHQFTKAHEHGQSVYIELTLTPHHHVNRPVNSAQSSSLPPPPSPPLGPPACLAMMIWST